MDPMAEPEACLSSLDGVYSAINEPTSHPDEREVRADMPMASAPQPCPDPQVQAEASTLHTSPTNPKKRSRSPSPSPSKSARPRSEFPLLFSSTLREWKTAYEKLPFVQAQAAEFPILRAELWKKEAELEEKNTTLQEQYARNKKILHESRCKDELAGHAEILKEKIEGMKREMAELEEAHKMQLGQRDGMTAKIEGLEKELQGMREERRILQVEATETKKDFAEKYEGQERLYKEKWNAAKAKHIALDTEWRERWEKMRTQVEAQQRKIGTKIREAVDGKEKTLKEWFEREKATLKATLNTDFEKEMAAMEETFAEIKNAQKERLKATAAEVYETQFKLDMAEKETVFLRSQINAFQKEAKTTFDKQAKEIEELLEAQKESETALAEMTKAKEDVEKALEDIHVNLRECEERAMMLEGMEANRQVQLNMLDHERRYANVRRNTIGLLVAKLMNTIDGLIALQLDTRDLDLAIRFVRDLTTKLGDSWASLVRFGQRRLQRLIEASPDFSEFPITDLDVENQPLDDIGSESKALEAPDDRNRLFEQVDRELSSTSAELAVNSDFRAVSVQPVARASPGGQDTNETSSPSLCHALRDSDTNLACDLVQYNSALCSVNDALFPSTDDFLPPFDSGPLGSSKEHCKVPGMEPGKRAPGQMDEAIGSGEGYERRLPRLPSLGHGMQNVFEFSSPDASTVPIQDPHEVLDGASSIQMAPQVVIVDAATSHDSLPTPMQSEKYDQGTSSSQPLMLCHLPGHLQEEIRDLKYDMAEPLSGLGRGRALSASPEDTDRWTSQPEPTQLSQSCRTPWDISTQEEQDFKLAAENIDGLDGEATIGHLYQAPQQSVCSMDDPVLAQVSPGISDLSPDIQPRDNGYKSGLLHPTIESTTTGVIGKQESNAAQTGVSTLARKDSLPGDRHDTALVDDAQLYQRCEPDSTSQANGQPMESTEYGRARIKLDPDRNSSTEQTNRREVTDGHADVRPKNLGVVPSPGHNLVDGASSQQ